MHMCVYMYMHMTVIDKHNNLRAKKYVNILVD